MSGTPHHVMIELARQQRAGFVRAEDIIWTAVRAGRLGMKFRRQVPLGRYILDFVCFEKRLVVEIDGPSHATEEQRLKDVARDRWLADEGFRVLRLTNDLVIGSPPLAVATIEAALGG